MIAVSYSAVRRKFKDYCDKAANDFETIIITRERGDNVVMLSEAEYNNPSINGQTYIEHTH